MTKDKQQKLIKRMIESGEIKLFKEIFDYYPITHIIDLLKTNHKTFYPQAHNVDLLRAGTIFKIGDYFSVSEKHILDLVANQHIADKKTKKKR